MRKTLLTILFLALTVPVIGQEPKSHPVTVLIDSRPEFAEVRVDGKFVGSTPLNYRLTPGVHKLELTRMRYGAWIRELTVTEGIPTRVVGLLDEPSAAKPCPTETPAATR